MKTKSSRTNGKRPKLAKHQRKKSRSASFSPSLSECSDPARPSELDLSTVTRTFLRVNVRVQSVDIAIQERELILRGLFSWAKREARWLQPRDLFALSSQRKINTRRFSLKKKDNQDNQADTSLHLFIATTTEGAVRLSSHLKPSAKLNKCLSTAETRLRVKNSEIVNTIDPSCQSLLQLSWNVAQEKKMLVFRTEMSELANRTKNADLRTLCYKLKKTETINASEDGFNVITRCSSGARIRFSFLGKMRSSCLTCEKSTKYEFWWSHLPNWCAGKRSVLTNDTISLIVSFVMKPPLPEPPLENWFKQPEKLCELQQPKKKKAKQFKVYRIGILTNKSRFGLEDLEKRDVEDLYWSFYNVYETLSRL